MKQENAVDYQDEIASIDKMFDNFEKNQKEDAPEKEYKNSSSEDELENEVEESDAGEIPEEEEDEEETLEQKKQSRIEEKLKEHRRFKRKNYRLQHQVKTLEERNRELIQRLEDSTFLGTEHYAESAELKLKATKEKMKEAMRAGNEDEYIDLQEELYRATHEINQAKSLKEQNERYRYQETPNVYNAEEEREKNQEIINDWVRENPEINPKSKKFDKKLYNKLYEHVSDLNEELSLSGRTDLYLSSSYFKNLDNKLEKLKRSSYAPASVGSVRNSYSPGRASTKKIILSAAELDLINSSNGVLSEEGYIKQKLIDLKNGERR